jgi:AcrR family transcriptional regulator
LESGTSVPTAKIAKEASVSNGTLFNYFAIKQVLLNEIYLSIKREMASAPGGTDDIRMVLFAFWQSYFRWALNNMDKHSALNVLQSSNVLNKEAVQKARGLFQSGFNAMQLAVSQKAVVAMPVPFLAQIIGCIIRRAVDYAA